jgi:hypothetical protein
MIDRVIKILHPKKTERNDPEVIAKRLQRLKKRVEHEFLEMEAQIREGSK